MKKTFLAIFIAISLFSALWAMGESPKTYTAPANQYQAIDDHADSAPASELGSIESLTRYLIRPAKNDTEKVRAMYRWIAMNISYDTVSYFSGNYRTGYKDPAESTFRTKKAVCNGYAHLFKRMCDIAGLKAEIVSGWSKGYGYEIGGRLPKDSDHAWNVVWLDGRWQLIESTWGSGSIDDKTRKFVRKFDDGWFLTPPERFIYTHYPEEQRWQLLSSSVSSSDWQSYANYTDHYFRYGFSPEENKMAWLSANGSMVLTFTIPNNVVILTKLSYLKSSDFSESYTIERRNGDKVEVMTSFPTRGSYELKLYAKYKGEEGLYNPIVTYRVDANSGNNYQTMAKTYDQYNSLPVEMLGDTPFYSYLKPGYRYYFKINVPEADNVAVINEYDNSFQYLSRRGQTFEGWANIKGGKVKVSARFPAIDSSYYSLVEYN